MKADKILGSESDVSKNLEGVISTESINNSVTESISETFFDRIAKITKQGGVGDKLYPEYDNVDGDWRSLISVNPFEVLLLDYNQIKIIDSNLVKNNYETLKKFWEEKNVNMSGGTRAMFKIKYGNDEIVSNALEMLDKAYSKIKSHEGREVYFKEIENRRFQEGEKQISGLIRFMLKDNKAEISEVEDIFFEGEKANLKEIEIVQILKKAFDEKGFISFSGIDGELNKNFLLSTDWMTKEVKIAILSKPTSTVEVLGKEVQNLEQLGEVLFNNEIGAKEYIKNDVLKGSIGAFSADKANEYVSIQRQEKTEHLKYLRLIYRLNKKLPYRIKDKNVINAEGLANAIFIDPVIGKEHIKQGNIEVWFSECFKSEYEKLIHIRDSSESLEIAYLKVIYSFNNTLPYRFAGEFISSNLKELALKIDENKILWQKGKEELYHKHILIWLEHKGENKIINAWNKIVEENQINFKEWSDPLSDVGLEEFLHLLDKNLVQPELVISHDKIEFIKIPSGKVVNQEIKFSNITRGFLKIKIQFSKTLDGVTLDKTDLISSVHHDGIEQKMSMRIDSKSLKKGSLYRTTIEVETTKKQQFSIPVIIKVVFPIVAYLLQLLKYALLGAGLFSGVRALFTKVLRGNSWLGQNTNMTYREIVSMNTDISSNILYGVIGCFLILIIGLTFSIFFIKKYEKI